MSETTLGKRNLTATDTPTRTSITRKQVNAAIVKLNNLYGRGDVRRICHYANGTIIVIADLQYGRCTFRARVRGNTVRARNHQVTVR